MDSTWGNLVALLESAGVSVPKGVEPEKWFTRFSGNPATNAFALVGLSAVAFYLAERKHNPKVNDIWDAAIYTSTCMSVGYGDIFAKTPVGKILGTVLMTVGPSLAAGVTAGRKAGPDRTQEEVLGVLREILGRLPERR